MNQLGHRLKTVSALILPMEFGKGMGGSNLSFVTGYINEVHEISSVYVFNVQLQG